MKRTISNMIGTMSKKTEIYLKPYDLNHSTYWIWIAENYKYADYDKLREVEYTSSDSERHLTINTQVINSKDYILEQNGLNIFVKFIKANFEYQLDNRDEIILTGNFIKYA